MTRPSGIGSIQNYGDAITNLTGSITATGLLVANFGRLVLNNSMPNTSGVYCSGNGVVERGEDCDDSNKVSGDGCQNDCTFTCTKGTVNGDPRCDDHEGHHEDPDLGSKQRRARQVPDDGRQTAGTIRCASREQDPEQPRRDTESPSAKHEQEQRQAQVEHAHHEDGEEHRKTPTRACVPQTAEDLRPIFKPLLSGPARTRTWDRRIMSPLL